MQTDTDTTAVLASVARAVERVCPISTPGHAVDATDEICLLQPILEEVPVGLVVVNAQGRFSMFNREATRVLGLGAQDVPPAKWPQVYGCYLPDKATLYPVDRMPLVRALAGETVSGELMYIKNAYQREGAWVRVSSRPLPTIHGQQGWAVAALDDVTEHRKVNEEIELLSRAVEQTADNIVITDQDGQITYVNPAFEKTTGYTRDEVRGLTPRVLKSGLQDEEFYEKMWTVILAGKPFIGTLRNRKKNGDLYWAEQTITPIFGHNGDITHFVSVLKDITESRKQQEQQFEMRLAKQVQQRFYTKAESSATLDVGAAVHPAGQTGGDYVDFITTAEDGQETLGVAVGDVGGHGFDAALVMALTRAYVRSFWNQGLGVGKVLNGVNRMLAADLEDNRFVTLMLANLDFANGVMSYASAGHVPGFVLNASGNLEMMLESTGIPLGILEGHRFGSRFVPLQPGHIIVLLTDGVTEAGDDEPFGIERVIECVREHRGECAQQIAERVYRAVRAFSTDGEQQDDISMVILKTL